MVGILTTIAPTVLTLVISGRQTQQQRWHYVKRMCNRLQQLITTSNTLGLTKLPRSKSMFSIINVFCCQFFRQNFNFSSEEDTLICIKKTGSLTQRWTNFLLKSDNTENYYYKKFDFVQKGWNLKKMSQFSPTPGKMFIHEIGVLSHLHPRLSASLLGFPFDWYSLPSVEFTKSIVWLPIHR